MKISVVLVKLPHAKASTSYRNIVAEANKGTGVDRPLHFPGSSVYLFMSNGDDSLRAGVIVDDSIAFVTDSSLEQIEL